MAPLVALLDFDGVIADTENIHVAAWERTFLRMGWDVPPEVCAQAAEIDDRRFLRDVFLQRGVDDGDIEGWTRCKQDLTRAMLADSPRLYPGVARLVAQLRRRAVLAVVSTTWRANVEIVLTAAGLADAFALIVGKEDVNAVKPDPAAYLLALQRLGRGAAEAVALEDSPSGLDSAVAAGIPVVAVGHRRPPGGWCAGHPYLENLRDGTLALRTLGFR
jgi:HAD superfamily hydrolase (TIGR01509 family)